MMTAAKSSILIALLCVSIPVTAVRDSTEDELLAVRDEQIEGKAEIHELDLKSNATEVLGNSGGSCCCTTSGYLVATDTIPGLDGVPVNSDCSGDNSLWNPESVNTKQHAHCNKGVAENSAMLTMKVQKVINDALTDLKAQMVAALEEQQTTLGVEVDMTPITKMAIKVKEFVRQVPTGETPKWKCCGMTGKKLGKCGPPRISYIGCVRSLSAPQTACDMP